MRTIEARNVCGAWKRAIQMVGILGLPEESRGGSVLAAGHPVCTIYRRPWERVLFSPARDANPFFHLFEAMWMIAGRNDAAWLDTWVRDFSARFAESDGAQHGAYGHRWRSHFDMDQLLACADVLIRDPGTRQAVLQMWDPLADLGPHVLRDRPCNTSCYFRVVGRKLDLTVLCRSNDIVWGAYGANAVHMSVMHEWMSAAIGLPMGAMYQFSNNWHVYMDVYAKIRRRMGLGDDAPAHLVIDPDCDLYSVSEVQASPLFLLRSPPVDMGEVTGEIMDWCECPTEVPEGSQSPQLFQTLLVPMARAHAAYRERDWALAESYANGIAASDWRRGCVEWLERRRQAHVEREQEVGAQ